jgi:hypothetical protein
MRFEEEGGSQRISWLTRSRRDRTERDFQMESRQKVKGRKELSFLLALHVSAAREARSKAIGRGPSARQG